MTEFRFIHSSDLHLGRRFGNFPEGIRGRLVEARHEAISALAAAARNHGAEHVFIAGDLFDTETPSDSVWRQALGAMGGAEALQWWILPGNHDSLSAEALWGRVRAESPHNVRLIDAPEPIEITPNAVLLPAPVPSKSPGRDLTDWMPDCSTSEGRLRIGLAHGGILTFGSEDDGAETIPVDRATTARLDYLALGDWHGFNRIDDRTFYSGSPEGDRFKHQGHAVCLAVTIPDRGAKPDVRRIETGRFCWSEIPLRLTPQQDDVRDAFDAVLPANGDARRNTLLRLCASGWVQLSQSIQMDRAAEDAAPTFGYFELKDADLKIEYTPDALDEIDQGGALRMAADTLHGEAEDVEKSPKDRAIAAAALRRLYGYVVGEAK